MTAMDTLNAIRQGFTDGDPIAVLNIAKVVDDNTSEGHSITPYAVSRESDEIYRIYVYDNNFPGDANRFVEVNATNNHWKYYASANSAAVPDLYEGTGLFNPMCPIPLSMQNNIEIVNQQTNTTFLFNLLAADTQIENSKWMKINIETPDGLQSGYDFSTKQNVNQIPNTTEDTSGFSGYQASYAIADPEPLEIPSVITDIGALNQYLGESYAVTSAAAEKLRSDTSETAFLVTTVTTSWVNGVQIKQAYDPQFSASYQYRIHPSARIAAIDNPTKGLSVLLSANDQNRNIGYTYMLNLTEDVDEDTSLGALITDDGTLEVFLFNETVMQPIETGFAVIAKVVRSL